MPSMAQRLIDYYIGIPFADHGRSSHGLDCYGLVLHAYEHFFGMQLPDFIYKGKTSFVFAKEAPNLFIKISETGVKVGDLVVFGMGCETPVSVGNEILCSNRMIHFGVLVGNGRFLHANRKTGVVQGSLGDRSFRDRLLHFLRVKGYDPQD